jgi:hypothetical protein
VGWIGRIWKFVLRSARRIGVLVLGFALIGLGIVLLVLPGPGLLTIVAGLAVLATEFTWAAWLLRHTKRHAVAATRLAVRRVKALERVPFLRRYAEVLEHELEEVEDEIEHETPETPDNPDTSELSGAGSDRQ